MKSDRVPTGIKDFDEVIGGGFPRGSLLLIAGNPGTGKTIFSANFLYNGAVKYGEKGVYVSFAESRETFIKNMLSYGLDFDKLEKDGAFKFLDVVTVREAGTSTIFKLILNEIRSVNAKRVVLDSFSAMAQAFEKVIDLRISMHTILSKIVRQLGCTTLILEEIPVGDNKIGFGVEEFVADGVIKLERRRFNDLLLRELEILKLRGTEVKYTKFAFTLKDSFRVFPPITFKETTGLWEHEVIPHGKDKFSLGIRDLDKFLRGMVQTRNYDLFEIGRDAPFPLNYLIRPIICNFINQGYGVVILPPQGFSALTIQESLLPYINEAVLRENVRIIDYRGELEAPQIINLEGSSITEDFGILWDSTSALKKKTGKPVLSIVGFDTVEYTYDKTAALKILGEDVARIRNFGDLRINIIRPTIEIADQLRALSDIYLKIQQIDGALFLYGVKPETPLLNITFSTQKDRLRVRLTPIV